jgi:hypothetical protein
MPKTFFRHLCELVLRNQMRVLNYFVNSFYSAGFPHQIFIDFTRTNLRQKYESLHTFSEPNSTRAGA